MSPAFVIHSGDFELIREATLEGTSVCITNYFGRKPHVQIPSELEGNPVAALGKGIFEDHREILSVTIADGIRQIRADAFRGCSALRSITIPASVTELEGNPFAGCRNLQEIQIPDNHPVLESVSGILVKKERTLLFDARACQVDHYRVPWGFFAIGAGAFSNCPYLQSVFIPPMVQSIDPDAFAGCKKLTFYVHPGSCAERFAKEHGIPCEYSSQPAPQPVPEEFPVSEMPDLPLRKSGTLAGGVPSVGTVEIPKPQPERKRAPVRHQLDFTVMPQLFYRDKEAFLKSALNKKETFFCDLFTQHYTWANPIYYPDSPRSFRESDFSLYLHSLPGGKNILYISLPEEHEGSTVFCTAYALTYQKGFLSHKNIRFFTVEESIMGTTCIGQVPAEGGHINCGPTAGTMDGDLELLEKIAF